MVRRFLVADALSLLGNAAAAVILPWLVLVRTGNATAAGTVAAASALPMLLSAIGGGVLIDRFGRRSMSVIADLGSAMSIAALPIVDATIGLNLGWFVVLGVAGALFDVPGLTAREALLPEVARASGTPIERVAGLREGTAAVVLLVGPGAGAVLLALTGGPAALWLTAATSALAALVTSSLRVRNAAPGTGARPARGNWWAEVAEGWRTLRDDQVLVALTVLVTASAALVGSLLGVLLPVRLAATTGPQWLGAVITAIAVGSLLGAGLYAASGARLHRRTWFVAGACVHGAGLVLVAALPGPPVMLLGAVLAGAGGAPLSSMLTVIVAERVPDVLRGRVLGFQNAVGLGVAPVGMLLAGIAVDRFGVLSVSRLMALAWAATILVVLALPALRRLEAVDAHHR
ncbi:MAG: MFS transporter [Dactylosporangium sp.]|nr:MFS transporter [Dactylosporangium sp.]NNJ61134.1 MFS transporter [Dactylosporangium sp.]